MASISGASRIGVSETSDYAIKVPRCGCNAPRDAGVSQSMREVDVEGLRNRVLTGFLKQAPGRCGRARW